MHRIIPVETSGACLRMKMAEGSASIERSASCPGDPQRQGSSQRNIGKTAANLSVPAAAHEAAASAALENELGLLTGQLHHGVQCSDVSVPQLRAQWRQEDTAMPGQMTGIGAAEQQAVEPAEETAG